MGGNGVTWGTTRVGSERHEVGRWPPGPQVPGGPAVPCGPGHNELLRALVGNDETLLQAGAQLVHLESRQVLAVADERIDYVYFPLDAVIALLVPMEDGTAAEGGTIGREGVVGLHALFGASTTAEEIVVQVGGEAMRMAPELFRSIVARSWQSQKLVHGYTLAFMSHLARTAGCNQVHSVSQRVTRWLLMTRDRVGRDTFAVTHEWLASLLGVRRASVTQAAEGLQSRGLLAYRRGHVTILDAHVLEAEACEDYRLTRDAYRALYS